MMSPETIRDLTDRATRAAKHDHAAPRPLDGPDGPFAALRASKFLGDYVPHSWRRMKTSDFALAPLDLQRALDISSGWGHGCGSDDSDAEIFADASGWGAENEPALSASRLQIVAGQLLDYAREHNIVIGGGVIEAGQFQVYLGLYVRQRYPGDRDAYNTLRDRCAIEEG